jgi:hypothetical protein
MCSLTFAARNAHVRRWPRAALQDHDPARLTGRLAPALMEMTLEPAITALVLDDGSELNSFAQMR